MTRIILVRHGPTAWNEEGRLQGWTDVELSTQGYQEAAAIGAKIATTHDVVRVISSPLCRSKTTAEIIATHVDICPVLIDPGWRERSFGSVEGKQAKIVFNDHPELHPKSPEFSANASLDGESCRRVLSRVCDSWRSLLRQANDGDVIVVVTHETPLRLVVGLVHGKDPITALRNLSFAPGSMVLVDIPPNKCVGERA